MQTSFSLADLKYAYTTYNGRSCAEVGSSDDIIEGYDQTGARTGTGTRLDRNGTFRDKTMCCLVQQCVFGIQEDACSDMNLLCPSQWGRFDPLTCLQEAPQPQGDDRDVGEDAHRQGWFRSQRRCCEHFWMLDSGTPRDPEADADVRDTNCAALRSEAEKSSQDEDYLTA